VLEEGWFFDGLALYFEPIDTHSKLRLVDDMYLSVGSCNFNNRGYLYEGELNVEVLDQGFATDARREIFSNLVGPDWAHEVSDDAVANLELLATVAASNQAHRDWWLENLDSVDADTMEHALDAHTPSGFVYPLEFSSEYWWDVGPDLF
jgi:phosphatidylserine/phosphatidylglycerophosphate/cardiolipin synthase-like enzyme